MKLFLLSKEDIELSKDEVLALYQPDSFELVDNLLIFETNKDYSNRLAYTKKIYSLLKRGEGLDIAADIDFSRIIGNKSFRTKSKSKTKENELAKIIFSKLKDPKVELKNPEIIIEILETDGETIICKVETIISTDWRNRLPHKKPEMSPTSLNPRLAMAMINLAKNPKGVLCDPFCGTGGILVEGGLLGHKTIGFDIDEIVLRKAKINLDHYKLDSKLVHKSCLENNETFDFVVTDLPYGKNTKVTDSLDELYRNFFDKYYDLCSVMIIGLPSFIEYKKLVGKWVIEKEYEVYLHKNLSKKILILKKD
ncbi:hypothetical protein BVX95_01365 [archaeon D22]|nr:hypothetical protein BVX95_01365 [archaeon D22]